MPGIAGDCKDASVVQIEYVRERKREVSVMTLGLHWEGLWEEWDDLIYSFKYK